MYTAFSLTSSVNSVRCAESWLFSLLGLERFARILVVISCIVLSMYIQTDINLAVSMIKALLFYFSGTNSYGLRTYVHQLAFPNEGLPPKDIRGKSSQYIEIISVPNCVISMSELPSPREESSHGKPSQNVWRNHTHLHHLCPIVFVISLIYQYISACNYKYSSDSSFMCQYSIVTYICFAC